MLRHFIIEIPLYHRICQVVACERFKTKYNFKLLALKLIAVTYEMWLQKNDLTHKLWVFWETGCWGDVVAYVGWLQLEFRRYFTFHTMSKLMSRYEIFGSCPENCHSCNSELTESQVFKATFPWDELVWRLLPYHHNSSNSCQRFRSPIIPRKGWEVMSFNPHKTTFLSLLQHLNKALIPVSDKLEFQLASISLHLYSPNMRVPPPPPAPSWFQMFLAFGNLMKPSHSFLKYYLIISW